MPTLNKSLVQEMKGFLKKSCFFAPLFIAPPANQIHHQGVSG